MQPSTTHVRARRRSSGVIVRRRLGPESTRSDPVASSVVADFIVVAIGANIDAAAIVVFIVVATGADTVAGSAAGITVVALVVLAAGEVARALPGLVVGCDADRGDGHT